MLVILPNKRTEVHRNLKKPGHESETRREAANPAQEQADTHPDRTRPWRSGGDDSPNDGDHAPLRRAEERRDDCHGAEGEPFITFNGEQPLLPGERYATGEHADHLITCH
jgi:hypothetical protein